jgi:hypothetical protein
MVLGFFVLDFKRSEPESPSDAEDADDVLVRVERGLDDHLGVRRDGEPWGELHTVENLACLLIFIVGP